MHSQFEQLFVVLAVVPAILVHLLLKAIKRIGNEGVWISIGELTALLLSQFHEFGIDGTRHLAALAKNHTPDGIVHHDVASLALLHSEQVHQGNILGVLREWRYQWGITHARPYILYFVEQLDQHVVHRECGFSLLLTQLVDHRLDGTEVGHHRAHHATRQATAEQKARHVLVGRIDEATQPVVNELLGQTASLHIGIHIDVCHLKALVLQHRLHADDVGMHLTPRQGLYGCVDDVGTVVAHLQDARHRQARARVSVILYHDVGMLGLDVLGQRAQQGGLSYTCHILQTDLLGSGSYHLVGYLRVIFYRMHRRCGDAQRGLGYHACLLGPLDAGNNIARVIQTAEDTGNVHALSLLHLVHQGTHIVGHGVHAQRIQATVQHVSLDTGFIEGLTKRANGVVRVLASHQVHLLEGTAVGFHTAEAPHVDDDGSYTF